MTIKRLLILQVVLACGLGVILLIPREGKIQPCRVKMELPTMLNGMVGEPAAVSDAEHAMLAEDTQFCRKIYKDFDNEVWVSIVLSGNDLDNSIHRPERCLPAQGWRILDSKQETVPVSEAPAGRLPVTRLYTMKEEKANGQVIQVYNLNYYWFIGYSDLTASHFEREYIDMKDRLLHGYNQRWAYVTVASRVTKGLERYGKDVDQTDEMLHKVIAEIYPQIVGDAGGNASATARAN